MTQTITIEQGDCISSIAAEYGFLPDTIWNDPANADLKKKRENGNILFEGDVLTIPDTRIREETGDTDQQHNFVRKGIPEKLKLVFLDERDLPRKDLRYELTVKDGKKRKGVTKSDGSIEESIPATAQEARLVLFDGDHREEYPLKLGHLDPLTETRGIQMRLSNLGFDCPTDGELDDETVQAIMEFQEQRGLEVTGEIDDEMRQKLKEIYGS